MHAVLQPHDHFCGVAEDDSGVPVRLTEVVCSVSHHQEYIQRYQRSLSCLYEQQQAWSQQYEEMRGWHDEMRGWHTDMCGWNEDWNDDEQ